MAGEKCPCVCCNKIRFPYWYNPKSGEGFCSECYQANSKNKLLDLATGN